MSLIPYALTRPFLFGLDPEAAHDLTMDMLARGQGTPLQWAWCNETVHDPIELAGLRFPNRVGLAAGLDKNARCIDALGAMGFGFVEVGTVTPKGQPGNPKPRMFRLPEARALINRLGFNNDGLDAFLHNVQQARFRRQQKHPMLLGLNIGKNAATPIEDATRDYLTCLDGVYPHADYVTVNISSPNTKNLRALQSDAALDGLLEAIAERREQLAQQHARARRHAAARALVRENRPRPGRRPGRRDRHHPAAPRHGRRGGHQHHHRPQRRAGHAPRRGNRRPERRPGAGAQQPGHPPAARRAGATASPSSAWAAS
jgi:dihydroorotate dehydrogenase